jgi:DNA-binding NarL/FixJ family response regulator
MAKILLATDAAWVRDEIVAALDGPHELIGVRNGRHVVDAVQGSDPDLVILDLQIGSMGGMATCMALRLEESGGRVKHVPVLMLLDRVADLFLAQRCDADGWLIKPLDALRIARAVRALLAGDTFVEGLPAKVSEIVADVLTEPAGVEAGAAS